MTAQRSASLIILAIIMADQIFLDRIIRFPFARFTVKLLGLGWLLSITREAPLIRELATALWARDKTHCRITLTFTTRNPLRFSRRHRLARPIISIFSSVAS